ncbi:MAG: 7-carboxy-7-deazaguanine synthase [Gaiellales bacterium]|nr:7-carboxy-7-deazaguanine synthase [Gaiellales bacterium]
MTYAVKEIFYTLQGEGANAGRPAVFCRFAGCNLWSGQERDRHTAVCTFCDTDFVGTDGTLGGKYRSAPELAAAVAGEWPRVNGRSRPLVVCTGGEPLLQIDAELVAAFHAAGLEIAVETNGTLTPPDGIDWICVSPKAGSSTVLLRGNELKLVYPQEDAPPERFADTDFEHFYLQPMDGPELAANVASTVAYCLAHPQWRLSLQTHKITGIR